MSKHTFNVVFEIDGDQQEQEFTIDIGEWFEEDFQGGDGEEFLEKKLLALYPEATLCWIECPEGLPQ